jgi:ATP-binding cassette, subfamily B, bacterial PglK
MPLPKKLLALLSPAERRRAYLLLGMILVMAFLEMLGVASIMPIIALYAFAGYRLLPALQQVYAHLTLLRFSGPALETLHRDLVGLAPQSQPQPSAAPLPLERAIVLEGLTYAYPNAAHPVVRGLDLEIPARATVGLVGATGSGKTTVVDLILGLLQPQAGQLRVDGALIAPENRRAWQRSLGYVPQQIYLADDSVAANIAFGVPPD